MGVDPDSVRVYTVNGATAGSSSSLPDWLTRKRELKGKGRNKVKEHVEGAIELVQDFEFPEASNRVKTTRDGQHIIATGTYKPQMRVWDLDQLSLKFERHSDAENVDFVVRGEEHFSNFFFFSGHIDLISCCHVCLYRFSPTTGRKRSTCKTTGRSSCTRKEASITAHGSLVSAVLLPTTFHPAMPTSLRRARKCTASISTKAGS